MESGVNKSPSREIYSNQQGIQNNLEKVVRKHLNSEFRKPPAEHTVAAFNHVSNHIVTKPMPIIFDSCCGTGFSSRKIAKQYPNNWVIGLDRSAKRLNKEDQDPLPDNCLIAQVDCVDFWNLAVKANWQLEKHFLLYPNPYPKSAQLKSRWHGHPAFVNLLKLGGNLEVRSNWQIYILEFAEALQIAGQDCSDCEIYEPTEYNQKLGTVKQPKGYLTLFERKYHLSGQTLYRCLSRLRLGNTG